MCQIVNMNGFQIHMQRNATEAHAEPIEKNSNYFENTTDKPTECLI